MPFRTILMTSVIQKACLCPPKTWLRRHSHTHSTDKEPRPSGGYGRERQDPGSHTDLSLFPSRPLLSSPVFHGFYASSSA